MNSLQGVKQGTGLYRAELLRENSRKTAVKGRVYLPPASLHRFVHPQCTFARELINPLSIAIGTLGHTCVSKQYNKTLWRNNRSPAAQKRSRQRSTKS